MGVTYTEEYETRKAVSELEVQGTCYRWDYIAKGPIDGKPTEVNATIYKVEETGDVRIGYGMYMEGDSNVRIEAGGADMDVQVVLASRFYEDIKTIVS